jgi:hypothetical protein
MASVQAHKHKTVADHRGPSGWGICWLAEARPAEHGRAIRDPAVPNTRMHTLYK